jgi:hypothetical protein
MARITKYRCDRCGREEEDEAVTNEVIIVSVVSVMDTTRHQLCALCSRSLRGWLDTTGFVPVGYKRVPRPCPHHVPCADPNGCSGTELVPDV